MKSVLRVEWVSIDDVHPNSANPRLNEAAVEPVAASLRRFGWQQPIVAKPSGEVVAGHTRLRAARELGMEQVPVVRFEGSDLDAVAFGIADNKTHEFAGWDEPALAELLTALQAEDALDGVGFADDEIQSLLRSVEPETGELEDTDPGEVPESAVSVAGDLWVLGKHRLLCGDSTKSVDVARLLGGQQPGIMVTDPPYGVEYDPEWRKAAGVNNSARMGKVANDDRIDWSAAWALFPGNVAYVWHAGRFCGPVAASLYSSGLVIRAQVIWAKSRFALSRGHYHWQHEPCWYVVREGKTSQWTGDRKQSTVWDIAVSNDGDPTIHGTQKPLECMARPMRNHDFNLVYDPILGSGTTLIAAENLGRSCMGMELDPRYVDVIIDRWQRASGLEAKLESGESFAQVAEARA